MQRKRKEKIRTTKKEEKCRGCPAKHSWHKKSFVQVTTPARPTHPFSTFLMAHPLVLDTSPKRTPNRSPTGVFFTGSQRSLSRRSHPTLPVLRPSTVHSNSSFGTSERDTCAWSQGRRTFDCIFHFYNQFLRQCYYLRHSRFYFPSQQAYFDWFRGEKRTCLAQYDLENVFRNQSPFSFI